MDWDEGPDLGGDYGPYRQSERMAIYRTFGSTISSIEGKAYESYKTEEELEAEREQQRANSEMPHYVYEYAGMNAEEEKLAKIAEAKAKGLATCDSFPCARKSYLQIQRFSQRSRLVLIPRVLVGDFVIQKRDGMPTYNFAVVVDDHMMKISHVLRGDDHIANTPKQLMIYEAFGWTPPVFGHMTLNHQH
jgi:nondiscriminating glutamyl-tRNA synthetase